LQAGIMVDIEGPREAARQVFISESGHSRNLK
jgi:hypothetical protein